MVLESAIKCRWTRSQHLAEKKSQSLIPSNGRPERPRYAGRVLWRAPPAPPARAAGAGPAAPDADRAPSPAPPQSSTPAPLAQRPATTKHAQKNCRRARAIMTHAGRRSTRLAAELAHVRGPSRPRLAQRPALHRRVRSTRDGATAGRSTACACAWRLAAYS